MRCRDGGGLQGTARAAAFDHMQRPEEDDSPQDTDTSGSGGDDVSITLSERKRRGKRGSDFTDIPAGPLIHGDFNLGGEQDAYGGAGGKRTIHPDRQEVALEAYSALPGGAHAMDRDTGGRRGCILRHGPKAGSIMLCSPSKCMQGACLTQRSEAGLSQTIWLS